jgi:hypothetical protein
MFEMGASDTSFTFSFIPQQRVLLKCNTEFVLHVPTRDQ